MTHHRIPLWIDLRHVPLNKRLPYLHVLEEVACERVLVERGDPHTERPGLDPVTVDGHRHLKHNGQPVGRLVKVADAKGQEKAAKAEGLVIVDAEDWRVIPLENLVAARRDRPGTLFALARTPQQAALFADTLETGVHGIVLAPESPQAIVEADQELRRRWRPPAPVPTVAIAAQGIHVVGEPSPSVGANAESAEPAEKPASASSALSASSPAEADRQASSPAEGNGQARPFLEPATVTSVSDGGMGDRVCVDTTSLFRDGEGLLVGSTARSFCLVHAETLKAEYLQPRPFRVNAGAVHMYLFAPEGKTRYLSEVAAGQPVLAVHPDGIHRVLTVGRAKIERRPHTLVRWRTSDGRTGHAMLQTAETIRLVAPDGAAVAVTDLQPGQLILVHGEDVARHTGLPVDSHLEER
jgi:3-dehydroquinate synthase class II